MQTSWKWKEKQGSSVLQMKWWQTTRPSSFCLIIWKRSWDGYKGSGVWSGGVSNICFQIHFQRNRFFSDPYLTLLTSSLCFPGSVYDKGVIWRKREITAIHVGPFPCGILFSADAPVWLQNAPCAHDFVPIPKANLSEQHQWN